MIKYTDFSMPVTSGGFYLVRVEASGTKPSELVIAEAQTWANSKPSWNLAGCDYDLWAVRSETVMLTVLCKFDLEAIANNAARVLSPAQAELEWYATEVEALAKAVQEQNHAVIAACMTVLSLDGGKRARRAL